MSVTSGFFNSTAGDPRTYDAEDVCSLFGGFVKDGVYEGEGNEFAVAADGTGVTVGSGRAWALNRWLYNDEAYSIEGSNTTVPTSTNVYYGELPKASSYQRYDAVIIQSVPRATSVNKMVIAIKTGASDGLKPTPANTSTTRQLIIAYILRPANNSQITSSNIEMAVGTSVCPYVQLGNVVLSDAEITQILS